MDIFGFALWIIGALITWKLTSKKEELCYKFIVAIICPPFLAAAVIAAGGLGLFIVLAVCRVDDWLLNMHTRQEVIDRLIELLTMLR